MLLWPYPEYQRLKDGGRLFFPWRVALDRQGALVLDESYRLDNAQAVAAGSEIISINGIPGAELISKLQDYGNGETVRLRQEMVLSRFGLMLWAGLGWMDRFAVTLRAPGQPGTTIVLDIMYWTCLVSNDAGYA